MRNNTKPRLYMDGDQWCAVPAGFINLQESPAGFGSTMCDAVNALNKQVETPLSAFSFVVEETPDAG